MNHRIGLEETDDGVGGHLLQYFNTVLLATLDERDFVIRGWPQSVTHVLRHFVTYLSGCSGASASIGVPTNVR